MRNSKRKWQDFEFDFQFTFSVKYALVSPENGIMLLPDNYNCAKKNSLFVVIIMAFNYREIYAPPTAQEKKKELNKQAYIYIHIDRHKGKNRVISMSPLNPDIITHSFYIINCKQNIG